MFRWIFIFFAVAAVANCQSDKSTKTDIQQLVETLRETCIELTRVEEENTKKLADGIFVDDDKIKCYSKCLLYQSGVMDENGELDFAPIGEMLPEEHKEPVKKMFDNCGKKSDETTDLCLRAYNFFKCCFELDPEHYKIF